MNTSAKEHDIGTGVDAGGHWHDRLVRFRLLDLFCCEGGAGTGYARAGFDVTGVDIARRERNPHPVIEGDAVEYAWAHAHKYDVIHASPPCQSYSKALRHMATPQPKLIDAIREALVASGKPWVIENVVGAPLVAFSDLFGNHGVELCGTMFGLRIYRHRLFETSFPIRPPRGCDHSRHAMNPHRAEGRERIYEEWGNQDPEKLWAKEMGVEWMSRNGAREAVPPCFTEYIGRHLYALCEAPASAAPTCPLDQPTQTSVAAGRGSLHALFGNFLCTTSSRKTHGGSTWGRETGADSSTWCLEWIAETSRHGASRIATQKMAASHGAVRQMTSSSNSNRARRRNDLFPERSSSGTAGAKGDSMIPPDTTAPAVDQQRLVLPLRHDRDEFADWGWVRDQTNAIVYIAKTPSGADLDAHRRAKTDPTQGRVDALLKAFEIVQRLAEWSKKYPRQQIHSFNAKVDEQLVAIENEAKAWMDGQNVAGELPRKAGTPDANKERA